MKSVVCALVFLLSGVAQAQSFAVIQACIANTKTKTSENLCIALQTPPHISLSCRAFSENETVCLENEVAPDVARGCLANTRNLRTERICLESEVPAAISQGCVSLTDENQEICLENRVPREIGEACFKHTKSQLNEKICLGAQVSAEVIQGCNVFADANAQVCLQNRVNPNDAKFCFQTTRTLNEETSCLVARSNPIQAETETCRVKQTGAVVAADTFFNSISQWASQNNNCAIAKISGAANTGRVYSSNGSRVAKDRGGLSNNQVDEVLSANGLTGCRRFSCEK